MKYLTFLRSSETLRETPPPPALMQAMGDYIEKMRAAGALIDTGGLLPSNQSARIRLSNGTLQVFDGPFAETKEVIGGWAILEAPTLAEAIRLASEFMELHRTHWPAFEGESEIRPMFDPAIGSTRR